MNKLIALLKVEMNNSFSISKNIEEIKSGKDLGKKALILILFLSMLPILILLYGSLNILYDILDNLGKGEAFLFIGVLSILFIELIFGFIHILSKYYYSEDISILIPLPIKNSHIIISKFLSVVFRNYIYTLPLFTLFLRVYGLNNSVGFDYYLYSIIGLLTISIFPLFLVSIFLIIFMKYTNLSTNRDRLRIIFSLIFIIIIILLQIALGKIPEDLEMESKIILSIKDYSDRLLNNSIIRITPLYFLLTALLNSGKIKGLINISIYIIYLSIIFLVLAKISDKFYLDGLLVQKNKKKTNRIKKDMIYKRRWESLAIFKKEISILIRTPVYMINTLAGIFIGPAVFFIILGQMDKSWEDMTMILLNIGITVIFLNISVISSATSISREGDNYWMNKVLPIKAESQAIGRILASFSISLIQIILIIIAFIYRLNLNIKNIILFLLINISSVLMATIIALYIDLRSPKLDWNTPEEAMKRNMNVLKSIIINTIMIFSIMGIVFFIIKKINITILISSILYLVIAYLYYNKLIIQFKKI